MSNFKDRNISGVSYAAKVCHWYAVFTSQTMSQQHFLLHHFHCGLTIKKANAQTSVQRFRVFDCFGASCAQDWPPRHERCEDPVFAKEKGLTLDLEYYLLNQVVPLVQYCLSDSILLCIMTKLFLSSKPLYCHYWSQFILRQFKSSKRLRVRTKLSSVHVWIIAHTQFVIGLLSRKELRQKAFENLMYI